MKYIIYTIMEKVLLGLYIILTPLWLICIGGIWLKKLIENIRITLYCKCVRIEAGVYWE